MSKNERHAGHAQYLAWLDCVGRELSPLHPLREPLMLGDRPFWSVEALWQGTKRVCLARLDLARLDDVPHEVLACEGEGGAIWFPEAGAYREDFGRSPHFRLLKSGKKWQPRRNRAFGLGNWHMAGHWHPQARVVLDPERARLELHEWGYRRQLAQFPAVLERLKQALESGELRVTPELLAAHGHVRLALECAGLA